MAMNVTMPARSLDQRFEALARANEIRRERADFKRELRTLDPDEALWVVGCLLLVPPAWAENWVCWDLLSALPKFGRVKVSRTLAKHGVSQRRRVGALSARQRRELQEALVGPLRRDARE